MSRNKQLSIFASLAFFIAVSSCKPSKTTTQVDLPELEIKPEQSTDIYRATYTQHIDLLHTELHLKPDWKATEMEGRAIITFKPHFYPADSFEFDAKMMEIHAVSMIGYDSVRFDYKGDKLTVFTGKKHLRTDTLRLTVNYTARPERMSGDGSFAIQGDKGLYFINPERSNPYKPRQLWTQGETESNSVWFPTIESPAQKMTQDIFLTVDTDMTTVSNGKLISRKNNDDGTRTDHWKQSLPAAPYLTMIAAGNFSVTKDRWNGIDVGYYVDPDYGKHASLIFGETPAMLTFFSERFGVKYPWEKFDQLAVHDYVSGAMESTTAVIHGTNMQLDPREVIENEHIDFISHELAHHWFGDLVTCESWSNITLNEGFATYSEYLWRESRYGRDDADAHLRSDLSSYLRSTKNEDPSLIRFYYESREDVFDAVSYKKGGCILHMLRYEVGDDAFFTAIKNYLESHKFGTAEVNDLRMAFEKTSGQDLNWFFNQWFLSGGHPSIDISYEWIDSSRTQRIVVEQSQDGIYRLPLKVDFYLGDTLISETIDCLEQKSDFEFTLPKRPELVNVDANKTLVGTKTDKHSDAEWVYQYRHAPLFLDRFEAVSALSKEYKFGTPAADVVFDALSDPSPRIRKLALEKITVWAKKDSTRTLEKLKSMAQSDSVSAVRVEALDAISKKFKYPSYADVIHDCMKDSSYEVVAKSFEIIAEKDSMSAKKYAPLLEKDSSGVIRQTLADYYAKISDPSSEAYMTEVVNETEGWYAYLIVKSFGDYLKNQDGNVLENGITTLHDFCKWHESGFEKSAGVAALRSLKNSLDEKCKALKKGIDNSKTQEYKAPLQKELDFLNIQTERANEIIAKYADLPIDP